MNKQKLKKKVASALQHHQAGNIRQAETIYRQILRKYPTHAIALHCLGVIAIDRGDHEDSVSYLRRAITANPDVSEFHYNLGVALQQQGQYGQAMEEYLEAIRLQPDNAEAYDNLGTIHQLQGRIDSAITAHTKASQINPNLISARNNLHVALKKIGKLDEVIESIRQSLNIDANDADAHWNLAMTLLLQGTYREGWQEYRWGFKNGERQLRNFPYTAWTGTPLDGRAILVYAEQGVGDEVMFASCLPDIIAQASHCIIECDTRLAPLFARSFPDATVHGGHKDDDCSWLTQLEAVDTQCNIGSLPRYLRNGIGDFPAHSGYLVPDVQRYKEWRQRYAQFGEGLNVGISWRGGNKPQTRQIRSTVLSQWRSLFAMEGIHFINLQYGDCVREIEEARVQFGVVIHDWDDVDPLKDLDSFAAQIAALDLVVSIDNSTVHMAGALNVPVWTLLPCTPDWRWMRDREDTPWYPSMTLLRQPELDDWEGVFQCARRRLTSILENAARGSTPRVRRDDGQPDGDQIDRVARSTFASRTNGDPAAREIDTMKAVLLNDTSSWYHWGCTCTSTAIHEQLQARGLQVSSVPIDEIYACKGTLETVGDLDDKEFFRRFSAGNSEIVERIADSDIVIINGEGTLHGLSTPALNLLYIAYLSKTHLGKRVHIINHSCYPEDSAFITNPIPNGFYKKVYEAMDFIAVRETISANLLRKLGLNVTLSFDCLPLYIDGNYRSDHGVKNNDIVISGSVSWHQNALPVLGTYMRELARAGFTIKILVGAKAFPAIEDTRFVQALGKYEDTGWELVYAESAEQWLDTIAQARLLVSGRFHHSIAAVSLKVPFITLNSNTPKMEGLTQMLGIDEPIAYSSDDLLARLLERTRSALEYPSKGIASDEDLEYLRSLSRENFNLLDAYVGSQLEKRRRLRVVARKETDIGRWSDTRNLNPEWDRRASKAASFVSAGSVVLDLGCGSMALESMLPSGCSYLACDVAPRDQRTHVCDFNRGEFPQAGNATIVTLLGVLEYIYEPEAFLKRLREYNLPIVLSYCPSDFNTSWDRSGMGMANHFTESQLSGALRNAGFSIRESNRLGENELLLLLGPDAFSAEHPAPDGHDETVEFLAANDARDFPQGSG